MDNKTQNTTPTTTKGEIYTLADHTDISIFYGTNNAHIKLLKHLSPHLHIVARGNILKINGEPTETAQFIKIVQQAEKYLHNNNTLNEKTILDIAKGNEPHHKKIENLILHGVNGKSIMARTSNQKKLVQAFEKNDLLFAIGPAGSGKTYTAIALAVKALKNKSVKKIILSRPAVEAGEKLGFLPGDMKEKIDPYLQPLYDALQDMIPPFKLNEYLENGTIQIAPLAFMRGRTLSDAIVILDEAQNTTTNQIKMFLTRMGINTKMLITGDTTQIDLPLQQKSGLIDALHTLKGIKGIAHIAFDKGDIVRHPLVQHIVEAYEKRQEKETNQFVTNSTTKK